MSAKRLVHFLGLVISLIAIAFFILYVVRYWPKLPAIDWTRATIGWLALLVVLYLLTFLIAGAIWAVVMRGIGQTCGWWRATAILCIAQFAKYIPGNVGHFIGRAALAKADGWRIAPVAISMTVESAWILMVAAVLGLTMTFSLSPDIGRGSIPPVLVLSTVVCACFLLPNIALVMLRQPVFAPFVARFGLQAVVSPAFKYQVAGSVLAFLSFAIHGISMQIVAVQLLHLDAPGWLFLTGAFAMAWIAGYLTPGSPAGIGVRELVLLTLLTPQIGMNAVVVLSIGMRAISIIGDLIGFLIGIALRNITRSKILEIEERLQNRAEY